ncbi:MAG TPA: LPXTG cell wall anchor domain-containing protein [Thermoanaerobaculia bacterium]
MSRRLYGIVMSAFLLAGVAAAQQSTATRTVNFEIVSVNGTTIVYKDLGTGQTKEYVAQPDAKFTMDGKEMGLSDLKPGMKGSATVTTTTTTHPVVVTEVRNATVLAVAGNAIIVKMADGTNRQFTQADVEKRNAKLYRDGQEVALSQFRPNDHLSATIVTDAPPKVVSSSQVQAMVKSEPKPAPAAAAPAPAPAPAPEPAAAAAPAAAPAAEQHAKLPKTASAVPAIGAFGALLVSLGLALAIRRRAR